MRTLTLVLLLITVVSGVAGCGGEDRVRLATTTSTDNSGLLDHLLPPFTKATGIRVDVIAVGTGQALKLGRQGDADLLLVHARKREDAFVEEGYGVDRRDVMWNDFVVAGPAADPAGVKGMTDAPAALKKIAEHGSVFVSRGDDSGTHTCERGLWEKAGGRPEWDGYREIGQGMGHCLTMADEARGYVLTDRGTFIAFVERIDLVVLVEGDEALHNPYGAILVNPEKHEGLNVEGARRLLDYLTSEQGQAAIAAFRLKGKVLFHATRAD